MGSARESRHRDLLVDPDGTVVGYARTERPALHEIHHRFFRTGPAEFVGRFHAADEPLRATCRERRVSLAGTSAG
ncbi:hypothetical protein GCM10010517_49520 [Streptosporangium fragile]|uniref:GNAT family N-acetyltransferase n=1 Tax=Streptosporangium fragile TaxID=46186 RepID=A0ABN3W4T1_9ACTN